MGAAPAAVVDEALVAQLGEAVASRLAAAEPGRARVLVIAGSGLGGFAARLAAGAAVADYADLPGVGGSTVAGHSGRLLCGPLAGAAGPSPAPLLLMQGRRHLYEGISAAQSTLLLRTLLAQYPALDTIIISNAAGGLNPKFEVGDLMLISDHINMMNRNPLLGLNKAEWGPRFPDMSEPYSLELRRLAREVALEQGLALREGVYIAGHGPSYETRAEVAMLRHTLGGDAVGMSTAPETLVAVHMGRRVLGITFVSNTLTVPAVTTHEEVMENSRLVEERFSRLVLGIVQRA